MVICDMQGGFGCLGLIGNFGELGFWRVVEDMKLEKNIVFWNWCFGLFFIDSLVGLGFSIVLFFDFIVMNQYYVVWDLFCVFEFFFSDFDYKLRFLYIIGESYGGKYVFVLGYYVMVKFWWFLFKME